MGNNENALYQRVAALEERTKPKQKTLLDKVKDWGGVGTLLIALIYTFPSNLYQQIFQPDKKALEDLRLVIEQSTMILADGLKAASSATNPSSATQLNRYYTTRAYLVMAHHQESFMKYKDQLTPTELMVVGMNFNIVNRSDLAFIFLNASLSQIQKLKKSNGDTGEEIVTQLQALRLKAQLLFVPSNLQNLPMGRQTFKEAIAIAQATKSTQEKLSLIDLHHSWAGLERLHGDWACSETQLKTAFEILQSIQSQLFDNQQLHQTLLVTSQLPSRPQQPQQGCAYPTTPELSHSIGVKP
jgi:hypothetical protein